jgi:hypothetical protein
MILNHLIPVYIIPLLDDYLRHTITSLNKVVFSKKSPHKSRFQFIVLSHAIHIKVLHHKSSLFVEFKFLMAVNVGLCCHVTI